MQLEVCCSCSCGLHIFCLVSSVHYPSQSLPSKYWAALYSNSKYFVQEFSSDMNSRPVKRIEDVVRLRTAQFSEDSGPIAHPIRPESYIKMDNFYTVTVYEKGAEIIRVYHTLLGKEGFRCRSAPHLSMDEAHSCLILLVSHQCYP